MANTNAYSPFGTGSGSNVLSAAAWAALPARLTGFQSGIAPSAQFNTALRQSSVVSTMIAQFCADQGPNNINDDGNVATLEANFEAALTAFYRSALPMQVGMNNVKGSAAGGAATASFTIEQAVVAASLGGPTYYGESLTLAFNGATNGAGGMDTGSPPTTADLSIYAIYNPAANTWASLGCAGASSNGTIYSGAHLPAGYTASALLWSGKTDSSGYFLRFNQIDGFVGIEAQTAVSSASNGTLGVYVELSISSIVPANAKSVRGYADTGFSSTGPSLYIASDGDGVDAQLLSWGSGYPGDIITPFNDVLLTTAQAIYYCLTGSNSQNFIDITGYKFR